MLWYSQDDWELQMLGSNTHSSKKGSVLFGPVFIVQVTFV